MRTKLILVGLMLVAGLVGVASVADAHVCACDGPCPWDGVHVHSGSIQGYPTCASLPPIGGPPLLP